MNRAVFFGVLVTVLSSSLSAQTLKDVLIPSIDKSAAKAGKTPGPSGFGLYITATRPESAEAAAKSAIQEVKDGDSVWLTIASARPLSEIAEPQPSAESPAWYEVQIAPGPAASPEKDFGSDCFIKLSPEQAAKTFYTLSLAPATALALEVKNRGGKGSGSPTSTEYFKAGCLLNVVAGMRAAPGKWNNRLTLRDFNPSSPTYTRSLVSAPLTVDVATGFAKYAAMLEALDRCRPRPGQVLVCK